MIRIKNNLHFEWYEVKPTIFSDQSSQVWKLPIEFTKTGPLQSIIKWNFESEAEIIHITQLRRLLLNNFRCELEVPYFPYARQDKEVSNETTFARIPFLTLLENMGFDKITIYDVHSPIHIKSFFNLKPTQEILKAIKDFNPTHLFFPDSGALTRYSSMFSNNIAFLSIPKIYGEKVRDQLTGNITEYKIQTGLSNLTDAEILIIDDICDGGATFINAAKKLKELGTGNIGLYVSHGIFSKGFISLLEAGIDKIYTTNSFKSKAQPESRDFVTVYEV